MTWRSGLLRIQVPLIFLHEPHTIPLLIYSFLLYIGGAEIIAQFENMDATDAFMSLHSSDALKRLNKMPPLKNKQDRPVVDKADLGSPFIFNSYTPTPFTHTQTQSHSPTFKFYIHMYMHMHTHTFKYTYGQHTANFEPD